MPTMPTDPTRPPRLPVAVLAAVLLSPAVPCAGQPVELRPPGPGPGEAIDPPRWQAVLGYDGGFFAGTDPAWEDWETLRALVLREWDRHAVGVDVALTERFLEEDVAVALGASLGLWPAGRVDLRVRGTPDADVLPGLAAEAGLRHAPAPGWEAGLSARIAEHPGDDELRLGASLLRRRGRWLLRGEGRMALLGTDAGGYGVLTLRRVLGSPRAFAFVAAGAGRRGVTAGPGPAVELRTGWHVRAGVRRLLIGVAGISVTAGWVDAGGVPARRDLSVAVLGRF